MKKKKNKTGVLTAVALAVSGCIGAATLVAQDIFPQGEVRPVQSIAFDGKEFISAFNAASEQTRIVLVFSPT